ncbi:MAG TPA: PIN domain-containing protein [Steroidobacteraceae bacterium]
MLVDTGILVAAADASDRRSSAAQDVLQANPGRMVVTDAILSEAHHLISDRAGRRIAAAFLQSIDFDFFVEPSTRPDRDRAKDLCVEYLDAGLDYTDALTIAIAERIGEPVIATLDRRHFSIVRPRHIDAFEIVP